MVQHSQQFKPHMIKVEEMKKKKKMETQILARCFIVIDNACIFIYCNDIICLTWSMYDRSY